MYDGYIRVSRTSGREGESFQSPNDQRAAIQRFADAGGLEVRMNEPELDVSGSALQRPILDAIMERVEAGQSEGVIVSTVSRLSRAGLGDAIELVERIKTAGATVGFAELGNVDPSTITGEMIVNMWLSIARMQWRQYQASWLSSKTKAIKRGALVAPTPLGYERGDGGKLIPSDQAAKVKRLFEIAGEGGIEVAVEYARLNWPARNWSPSALRDFLSGRVYLGEIRSGDLVARDVIEPLVDETTWYKAQSKYVGRKSAAMTYPLSGLALCAGCGQRLNGYRAGSKGTKRAYRCARPECNQRPRIYAEDLEVYVLDKIKDVADRLNPDVDLPALEAARANAQAELQSYVTTASAIDAELFKLGLEARQHAYNAAQTALNAARDSEFLFDLEQPTSDELARAIDSLTVAKEGSTARRVKLKLAV